MAPVAHKHEVHYAPTFVALSHVAAAAYLTYIVSRGLYESYKALPPAQDTRQRIHRRCILAPIFGGLALLALATDAYYKLGYLTLSYKVWADEHGIAFPDSVFATTSNGTTRAPLYLTQWLTDTPIYHDAAEIVAEKARRFWWGNQATLATVPWSVLLAIEGRRRNIPFLWAYMLLAHLVNLSFAQNLFYLALLLAPSPLGGSISSWVPRLDIAINALFPPKPANWCPHPILFLAVLSATYLNLLLLPYAANTPSFGTITTLSRVFSFIPLILPTITPRSWGTVHPHPHAAYGVYTRLFRFTAVASALLHGRATAAAVLYNLPGAWKHRHSLRVPFDVVRRSDWERTTTAVGKVLGSASDHPVVGAAAADVVLAAVGVGLWAAVRGVGVDEILGSAVPFWRAAVVTGEVVNREEEKEETPATVRRSGRKRIAGGGSGSASASASASGSKEADDTPTPTPGTARRRGRPRKVVKAEPELAAETEVMAAGADPDAAYVPEPGVAAEVAEGDRLEGEDDWEAAAVAWGITALGGLGAGCAGVFGGECIAR
ncbi:hypothetical protein CONLIGDRAFT_186964 [Coniochaeta ligniaria NRRL 30616]|uniref:Uncharacterized protein n=1 Tax=Coniochaeta ligniaria NRRL 30616 TaxID=1408157 RepID=A0A1J7J2R6_9PEZI|nr:hypothetical protein CONLIGDRAFT_186964 [Coniochaeta ligniaria NRRL 30616]